MVRATAMQMGLPPRVQPCFPGTISLAISGLANMTPTGRPPPTALPRVMMSGSTGLPSGERKCW